MTDAIYWFDLAGVGVFALSGALAAARNKMDIVGFFVVALVAAIGGGTLRDLILGQTPVFWIHDPSYLYVCLGVAGFTFFWAHKVASRFKILVWADAFGLALFAIIGTQKAIDLNLNIPSALMMGVLTATAGGIIRDILCAEIPLILRREIYALAALAGSATFLAATHLELPSSTALILSLAATMIVRGPAIQFGWSLPTYNKNS
ncbi:MAG: trimeric intracellular cation channel family protein [Rhodospirillales bacterium]|nr:trimeric intracellular cation channel family protein [Rhodospirillales bacterium]